MFQIVGFILEHSFLSKSFRMTIIATISAAILFGYLAYTAKVFGIPSMVSDTFYQLSRNGWVFSVTLFLASLLMCAAILDSGQGIQALAFLGCGSLAFVGCAPNYLNQDEYKVHETFAILSAIGCVGWCISVNIIPTAIIALLYLLYSISLDINKYIGNCFHLSNCSDIGHPWYWAEVCCFVDTYTTYFLISL